jgi:phosphoserine aminotransferase
MDKLAKLNFYPGPSRLYDKVHTYAQEAFEKGLLSLNHRSTAFEELYRITEEKLLTFLRAPSGYRVAFVSSATECWEIVAQSLTAQQSYHLYNGSFGQKWYEYAKKINPQSQGKSFEVDTLLRPEDLDIPLESEWLCITQNETSNGTQVHDEVLKAMKVAFPDQFIAVDATSSLAGIHLDLSNADLWFASVQKCFGLPSGLGLLIYSEQVVEKAKYIGERNHYNSFLNIVANVEKYQTHYTPNILGIYLLFRLLGDLPNGIELVDENLTKRARYLYQYFQGFSEFQPISQNKFCLSDTVLAFKGEERFVYELKQMALQNGILLGNGYGEWKKDSFRIANFPAIPDAEFDLLVKFFDGYSE